MFGNVEGAEDVALATQERDAENLAERRSNESRPLRLTRKARPKRHKASGLGQANPIDTVHCVKTVPISEPYR